MASLYPTPRSERRRAEIEWRESSRPRIEFDIDDELDRMPRWAAYTVIFALGLILWSLVFGIGSFIGGLLP